MAKKKQSKPDLAQAAKKMVKAAKSVNDLAEAINALNKAADHLEAHYIAGGSIEMAYQVRANDARRFAKRIS